MYEPGILAPWRRKRGRLPGKLETTLEIFPTTLAVEHFAFAPPNPGLYACVNTAHGYWLYVGITSNLPRRFYEHTNEGWPRTGRPWDEPDLLCYQDIKHALTWPETEALLRSLERAAIYELCPLKNFQHQRFSGAPITDSWRLDYYEEHQRDCGLTRWAEAYRPQIITGTPGR